MATGYEVQMYRDLTRLADAQTRLAEIETLRAIGVMLAGAPVSERALTPEVVEALRRRATALEERIIR